MPGPSERSSGTTSVDLTVVVPWTRLEIRTYQFLAPFVAALGWEAADLLGRVEPELLVSRQGMLFFAEAKK